MTHHAIRFTLEELAREASSLLNREGYFPASTDHRVSAVPDERTIRYYTTLGLIDRPAVAGRHATYGRRHMLQLLAVKAHQALGLSLADIQGRLYGRSDRELEAILESLRGEHAPAGELPGVVEWREVAVLPGLRLMVEDGWKCPCNEEELPARLKAALDACTLTPRRGERSR